MTNSLNAAALTTEDLMRKAPSIFATHAHHRVSEKYRFLPSSEIIELLKCAGWTPVRAAESRVRTHDRAGYQRHCVRFRHQGQAFKEVGDSIPELVLVNSSDGSSAYAFYAGLFRLVCKNGLTLSQGMLGGQVRLRHIGQFQKDDVLNASYRILENVPRIADSVEAMRSRVLNSDERLNFANRALKLKYPDHAPIESRLLLLPRRAEDRAPNLWETMNCVQENLVKGGLAGHSESMRRIRTRPVTAINEDIRINTALWTLAEEFKSGNVGSAVKKAA